MGVKYSETKNGSSTELPDFSLTIFEESGIILTGNSKTVAAVMKCTAGSVSVVHGASIGFETVPTD